MLFRSGRKNQFLGLPGGKRKIAALVWARLGEPKQYIEPFAGSAAMLLGAPEGARVETINDADGFVANFWRAVAADVEASERATGRADIHDAFLAAIAADAPPAARLPRRVVLFGISALPYQSLQALAAHLDQAQRRIGRLG